LEHDLKQTTQERRTLSTAYDKLSAEHEALEKKHASLNEDYTQLQEQLRRLIETDAEVKTKLSQADEERDRFKHEVEILEEQKRIVLQDLSLSRTKKEKNCIVM